MKKKPSRATRPMRERLTTPLLAAITFFGLFFYFFPHWLPFATTRTQVQPVASASVVIEPSAKSEVDRPLITGKPIRFQAPSVNIDLPIEEGVYNQSTQKWTLSTKSAHYAVMTPQPNNVAGNTFIYGHNRSSVFARLLKIKEGEEVYIATNTGHTFVYALRSIADVDPTDISLFQYQGEPILTVQTCSGTWYENRRLFTFDLVSVEPSV